MMWVALTFFSGRWESVVRKILRAEPTACGCFAQNNYPRIFSRWRFFTTQNCSWSFYNGAIQSSTCFIASWNGFLSWVLTSMDPGSNPAQTRAKIDFIWNVFFFSNWVDDGVWMSSKSDLGKSAANSDFKLLAFTRGSHFARDISWNAILVRHGICSQGPFGFLRYKLFRSR